MSTPVRWDAWIHTWIDKDGIQRQAKIHYTRDDHEVVWDPRWLGDEEPWFDSSTTNWRCGDDELVTLGDPNAPHFGPIDPDEEEEFN
ncbi:hypothetical protein ACH4YO_40605 [Streptomyces noursei]|uniref:hypothetical protein n=1 Tax=Streptomyces noursei TaxID=1971 RepID=UPI00081D1EBE|nr:hypothetical protein SNOUR_00130 [Streptomyces noursei ATCC 11455]ANZ21986.1 hypothetical protein SNOUR_43820 [Streptomyces noursei ATCC 11455]MCZ0996432.1 hypothetical protein [Streptomyces noursei]